MTAPYFRIRDGVAAEKIVPPDGVLIEEMFTPEFVAALLQSSTAEVDWVVGADGTLKAPPTPTPEPDPVPSSVSRAQAKIQLLRTPGKEDGKTLLDDVTAAVNTAGSEVAIWFADAATWQRDNPYVAQLGSALGLSSTEIDDMFKAAAQIAA